MTAMMTNFVDNLLVDEESKESEEENEPIFIEESSGVGLLVNKFGVIYNVDKQSVDEKLASEAPPQQITNLYNLRRKGPICE